MEFRLRPFRHDDLAQLEVALADPEIRRWNPGPAGDAGATEDWMARRNDWTAGDHASWAITDDSGLLGSVSLHQINHDQRDAEVGYWVAPWARRRGAATWAVRSALSHAFAELRLHRVTLLHAVENEASCVVAARAGLRLEGVLRQSYRYADGDYHDEHLHAVLATDSDRSYGRPGAD